MCKILKLITNMIIISFVFPQSKCNEIADKYTEFDGVIKAIDLVLHKVPVYRHILINSSFKVSIRQIGLFFVYLAMIEIHLLQPEKIDIYKSLRIFISSVICTY